MNYKRELHRALVDAMAKDLLNYGQYQELMNTEVKVSEKDVLAFVGRVMFNKDMRNITIYKKPIAEIVKDGGHINGIIFKTVSKAMLSVFRHELTHLINHMSGGIGHDEGFRRISLELWGHTSIYAGDVNESIQIKSEKD